MKAKKQILIQIPITPIKLKSNFYLAKNNGPIQVKERGIRVEIKSFLKCLWFLQMSFIQILHSDKSPSNKIKIKQLHRQGLFLLRNLLVDFGALLQVIKGEHNLGMLRSQEEQRLHDQRADMLGIVQLKHVYQRTQHFGSVHAKHLL